MPPVLTTINSHTYHALTGVSYWVFLFNHTMKITEGSASTNDSKVDDPITQAIFLLVEKAIQKAKATK